MAQKQPAHLPLLYNPLLNCLFNNPQHAKAPFKTVISELAKSHNDFTILVPPAYILEDGYDPETATSSSKTFLKSLCYSSEDFIRSHIIRMSAPVFNGSASTSRNQSIIYTTLNGKQILLKNGMIFTGKGFKKSLRLNVLGFGYFDSFCDYFPRGSKFMMMYIEDSLIGSNFVSLADYMTPQVHASIDAAPAEAPKSKPAATVTFEMLLRSLPLLSSAVSEHYYKLFHHNNDRYRVLRTQTRKPLDTIKTEFSQMVEDAYKIMSDSVKADNPTGEKTFELLNKVLESNPSLDLNKLVHEYVELNLYDKVWSQLLFQFNYSNDDKPTYDPEAIKILSADKYSQLSCLSLNQLDISVTEPWLFNIVLKRVWLGVEEFSKLGDSSVVNSSSKKQIITNTINILTGGPQLSDTNSEVGITSEKIPQEEFLIDADTLVGMLIMVVVHSKVDNLEAHLYYLKNFNSTDLSGDGYMNYIISNLEAVILHLSAKDHSNLLNLIEASQDNYDLWSAIQTNNKDKVESILNQVSTDLEGKEVAARHFLKSRNINGESCLMFAVKNKNFDIFSLLLMHDANWFSIDDLLFDKNTTTNQNLLMTALINEQHSMCDLLVDIIMSNSTIEEQYAYFNSTDMSGRCIGHYLFHDLHIMKRVSLLIDWELQDNNSHTPLFSICRCYDHNDYVSVIEQGFKCVYEKYGKDQIDFDKHMDRNGNTLLHVILKGIPESQLLQSKSCSLNVNKLNNKSMIPLTLYVKYNRASNIEALLQDGRLDFFYEEPKNLYNIFDYLGFQATKATSHNKEFQSIERNIYKYFRDTFFPLLEAPTLAATNARFDSSSKDWVIFFYHEETANKLEFHETLEKIRQMVQLFDMEHPLSCFPDVKRIWLNYPQDTKVIPTFSKFRINRFIERLNIMFISMSMYSDESQTKFMSYFTINENKKKSVFELMKEIGKRQDLTKRRMGEVMLTQSQIKDIEVFLKYSLADLVSVNSCLVKLNKLLSVASIKQVDVRLVYDRLVAKFIGSEIVPRFDDVKFEWLGEHLNVGAAYSKLLEFFDWLQICLSRLIDHVIALLGKLINWKEIYDRIGSYNNELKRYEHKVPHAADAEVHPVTSESSANESTSFFSFGVENKKSRYRRLLMVKAEEVKKIMNFNLEIKMEHEALASEISHYLKFQSNVICFALKRFTAASITSLKARTQQLQRLHYSCKN